MDGWMDGWMDGSRGDRIISQISRYWSKVLSLIF
jgi:hypothetical protein